MKAKIKRTPQQRNMPKPNPMDYISPSERLREYEYVRLEAERMVINTMKKRGVL